MKRKKIIYQFILILCMILFSGYASGQDANPCKTGGQTCYFGIEINGTLCGYSVDTYCDGVFNGRKVRFESSDVTLKMSLLGADVDNGFKTMYAIDPSTGRAVAIEIQVINGQSVVKTSTRVSGETAYYSNSTSGINKAIPADNEVIISSQTWYPHLFTDFIKKGFTEKKYKVYDPLKGEVTEKGYTRKSEDNITLGDSSFHTLVLEETDLSTGVKATLWLNKNDGYNVKSVLAGRQHVYFADKSVTSRISFANMDDVFFAKVGKAIPDIMNLSWMKIRAQINSYGENLTVASLNFPGQRFEGNVTGSYIEGIFEIEPGRYDGKNSPPFPPDFRKSPELKKYLESEIVIESDDPLIISEAARITAGSKDSWEAAIRLSKWVAENIAGAVPGGISAINTLKMGEAECGGHSRLLAAFCRAVGIPARMAVGCMYTPYKTGSFGQHAWTEVYMGDAGWVPVDATISEINFIDAGHIRLGENATFRPAKMEIIDFRSGLKNVEASIPDSYKPMIGNYLNIEQYRIFKIVHRDGGLAIDIPGRSILDLNPPDEQGKWYPKLTREISLMSGNIIDGNAKRMIIHQYFRLKKISSPEQGINEVPEEFRKFLGNYQFAPAKLSLDVMFQNGLLTTQDPGGRTKERISFSKIGDRWIDKSGNYEIGFPTVNENQITGMTLTVKTEFLRGEPVTNAMEPLIRDSGIEAGLKKYDETKRSSKGEYFFSEQMLHQLGHQLLKENRIDDAILVFRKNVEEYPGSFMVNDALAETYLKKGDSKSALKYFEIAVKLNPDYDYGKKMIEELKNKL
jgi:tetratricopeptide (TPR) repeat protein